MPVAKSKLRLIRRDELLLGWALPGDLRDAEGRILLPAGEVVRPEHLERPGPYAGEGLYVGPDWDAPQGASAGSPAEVVRSVFLRHGAKEPNSDQRTYLRHAWSVPLTLVIEETAGCRRAPREIEVLTADLSLGGFAFYYRQYVARETSVRVQFDSLPTRPRLVGVVRNCRLLEGTRHRIGVQFIDPAKRKHHRRRSHST
jgi:hypothetical protein